MSFFFVSNVQVEHPIEKFESEVKFSRFYLILLVLFHDSIINQLFLVLESPSKKSAMKTYSPLKNIAIVAKSKFLVRT